MKTIRHAFLIFVAICTFSAIATAQTFSVELQIKNHPSGPIIFGSVKGDTFTPIDSVMMNQPAGKVKFRFPENAHAGIYRINLGKTAYAKVMDQEPQLLDFIFDNESLAFETDFKEPVEKLVVGLSKENKVWFDFLKKDKLLTDNIVMLEKQIDLLWQKSDTAKVMDVANQYNQLQMERDLMVMKTTGDNRGLFASQMIKNQRQPLIDGFLTPVERNQSFKKEFFNVLDFSNPALINSTVYTDNIFKYLITYNNPNLTQKQRENEYIKAIDNIVPNIKQNAQVNQFILGYLVHGFTVLKMDGVLNYISKKYNYPN